MRRFFPLSILMGVTLAVELWAEFSYRMHIPFLWLYHVFVIVEYSLLCWYFLRVTDGKRIRALIIWSIPLFAAASVWISATVYDFDGLPGHNINLEGLLVWLISTVVLFNLDARRYSKIIHHPDFWICCGWLVFFVGTFFSNGLMRFVMASDVNSAKRIFIIFNRPLNLILYSCLIAGLIWAIRRT